MSKFKKEKGILRAFYNDYKNLMPYYAVLDIINCFQEEIEDLEIVCLLLTRAYTLYVILEEETEEHKMLNNNFKCGGDSRGFKRYLERTIEELEAYERHICRVLDIVDDLRNS